MIGKLTRSIALAGLIGLSALTSTLANDLPESARIPENRFVSTTNTAHGCTIQTGGTADLLERLEDQVKVAYSPPDYAEPSVFFCREHIIFSADVEDYKSWTDRYNKKVEYARRTTEGIENILNGNSVRYVKVEIKGDPREYYLQVGDDLLFLDDGGEAVVNPDPVDREESGVFSPWQKSPVGDDPWCYRENGSGTILGFIPDLELVLIVYQAPVVASGNTCFTGAYIFKGYRELVNRKIEIID